MIEPILCFFICKMGVITALSASRNYCTIKWDYGYESTLQIKNPFKCKLSLLLKRSKTGNHSEEPDTSIILSKKSITVSHHLEIHHMENQQHFLIIGLPIISHYWFTTLPFILSISNFLFTLLPVLSLHM